MANEPYDRKADQQAGGAPDLGPGHDRPAGKSSDPRSENSAAGDAADPRDGLRNAEESGGLYNPSDGQSGSASPGSLKDSEEGGGLYNDTADQGRSGRRRNQNGSGGFLSRRRRNSLIAVVLATGTISLGSFLFFGSFSLNNFMKNVEAKGFIRYQVDLRGRSSKWLQAYMELRLGEIDDPNIAPKDRENLLFRSNRVDSNKYLTDWYRTMRASNFEQDLLDKYGIKFTSVAHKEGNVIKQRAGKITFVNTHESLTFDPSPQVFDAIVKGDPNVFNGELRKFVEVETFNSDKDARAALKAVLGQEYPQWWKAVKRFHLRHDIQNMIGVRSWRFFEDTRNAVSEKKSSVRNRLIAKAAPDSNAAGRFVQCLFGITDCKASSDPASPDARELPAGATQKEGDKTVTDANGNPVPVGDGSAEPVLKDAAGAAGERLNKIVSRVVSKAGVVSMLDSLSRFDQALNNNSLSKLVTQAKSAQAIGLYTAFAVAADQLTTGETSSQDVSDFMNQFSHVTNNEGWTTVIDPSSASGTASAASLGFTPSKNKQEYCSAKHQAEIEQPQNHQQAQNEFQYLCPQDQLGGSNNASALENAWNNGPGVVLHPILKAFHAATGGLFDIFNSVVGAVTGAVTDLLGLTGTIENAVSGVAEQALKYGGADSGIDNNTPDGQVAMQVIEGGSALGEATMRQQGGASTTTTSAALADKNVLAYENDQAHAGLVDRYLSTSNPQSLVSRQLFALSSFRISMLGSLGTGLFGSTFSHTLSSLFAQPAHAQGDDGYAAARFAGIQDNTYDMPPECLNADPLDMTPQSSTNADELGIFTPDELTWDLMVNKEKWYDALYAKVGGNEDLAKKVWNCALFDNSVRGGMGAQYGYKGEDAYGN